MSISHWSVDCSPLCLNVDPSILTKDLPKLVICLKDLPKGPPFQAHLGFTPRLVHSPFHLKDKATWKKNTPSSVQLLCREKKLGNRWKYWKKSGIKLRSNDLMVCYVLKCDHPSYSGYVIPISWNTQIGRQLWKLESLHCCTIVLCWKWNQKKSPNISQTK